MPPPIRYLKTADGVRLAWQSAGSGPPLVKAANWLTHLELDWDSPLWSHWNRFFAGSFRFVRYDERGCGLSDWEIEKLDCTHWYPDLEAVAAAAVPEGPLALLGISQGAAPAIDATAPRAHSDGARSVVPRRRATPPPIVKAVASESKTTTNDGEQDYSPKGVGAAVRAICARSCSACSR